MSVNTFIAGKGRGAAGYNKKMADAALALKPTIRKMSKHLRKLEAKIEDIDADIVITASEEERGMFDSSDGENAGAAVGGAAVPGPPASSKPTESTDDIVRRAVAAALQAQNESMQFQLRKKEWTVGGAGITCKIC